MALSCKINIKYLDIKRQYQVKHIENVFINLHAWQIFDGWMYFDDWTITTKQQYSSGIGLSVTHYTIGYPIDWENDYRNNFVWSYTFLLQSMASLFLIFLNLEDIKDVYFKAVIRIEME